MRYSSRVEALKREWLVEREGWRIVSLRDAADPARRVSDEERAAVLEDLAAHEVFRHERRAENHRHNRTHAWEFSYSEDVNAGPRVRFEPVRGDAINGWRCCSCDTVLPGPDQRAAFEHAQQSPRCAR